MDTPPKTDAWPPPAEDPDWLHQQPPSVSQDFVGRTLERVLADQRTIAAEAARVDEIRLPRDLLAAYAPPQPSPDFVERVRLVLARDRAASDLADLLRTYRVPPPSPEFVARTLRALREDRPRRGRLLRGPWRAVAAVAAAAALLVLAFDPFSAEHGDFDSLVDARAAISPPEEAHTYSPAPVAAMLTAVFAAEDGGALGLPAGDGLGLALRVNGPATETTRR